ncbi:MAG: hypothetical protein ACYCWE_04525 [Eubacteriales bacterium]
MLTLNITNDGYMTFYSDERVMISRSPVGLVTANETLYAPEKADITGNDSYRDILLTFPRAIKVRLSCRLAGECKWYRLAVEEISCSAEAFVFGPWTAEAEDFGDVICAAWFEDGSAVCTQSLNTKTVHGFEPIFKENMTGIINPGTGNEKRFPLLFTAKDMTRPEKTNYLDMHNVDAAPVPGEDALICGAAVALTAALSHDELLDIIGEIELTEKLPHPMIDGEWAKKSKRASEIYFVIGGDDAEANILMAERAGVRCLYFGDPFASWGHFDISKKLYPEGEEGFKKFVARAKEHGVDTGFHTLSNFIHTHDSYVTPVPDKRLLKMDETIITKDLSETDTEIFVRDKNNFARPSTLNTVRLGDELIRFGGFDENRMCLTDCKRGAFGTRTAAFPAETVLARLWDHGYSTLFPDIGMQNEMAERLGQVINDMGIRRTSFDGIEGCMYNGRGDYPRSEFARRIFEASGGGLICDSSNMSHYLWHVQSYANWGEPWYDEDHRGGYYCRRALQQDYFRKNLLPGMLGWYSIYNHRGRFEASVPENFEFELSRTVAFDAGACIVFPDKPHGRQDEYLDMIRLWSEFRFASEISDSLRAEMKEEHSDWHLSKEADGWELRRLRIETRSLDYTEQKLSMESGSTGYTSGEAISVGKEMLHNSLVNMGYDTSPFVKDPQVSEPLYCRFRIGTPAEKGSVRNLEFWAGWYGIDPLLCFRITANAGEYLEYRSGTELHRYDADFRLLETVKGEGVALCVPDNLNNGAINIRYTTDEDSALIIRMTTVRTMRVYHIGKKKS